MWAVHSRRQAGTADYTIDRLYTSQCLLQEQSAAERLPERFQPCLVLAKVDKSTISTFQLTCVMSSNHD